jgi:acyl carrier protein
MIPVTLSEELICQRLIEVVARYAGLPTSALAPGTAFAEVGISSRAAVIMTTELSDEFQIEIDPLLTWEHPTIAEAARAIACALGEPTTEG